MKLLKVLLLAFLLGLAFAFLLDTCAQNFPEPRGYVNDYANVFTESQKLQLEEIISNYEKKTSIEIAVVTVDDIQETVIEQYANKLFNTWGIGKKQSNAGLLIFLSLDTFDRGLRIEIGYGLEEFMTDYQASEITDGVMPLLKGGDYATALQNSVISSMNVIGDRSAEARKLYLAGLEKENEETKQQIIFVLMIIGGFVLIAGFVFFIYRSYKKRKDRLEKEARYKKITHSNLGSLQAVYDETVQAVEHLSTQKFYGADEVLSRLKRQEKVIKTELLDRLTKSKKHEDVVKIADDVDRIGDKLKDLATEIFENHNIEITIRGKLETQVENMKRKVQNSLPQARQIIDMVNKDNPESIWRNFDYKNLDRNVEASIDKSEQAVKLTMKQLESHAYKEAKSTASSAVIHMDNAYKYVQSIFDVNQQIQNGKEMYNQQISRLSELIKTTNTALQRDNVELSTKSKIADIKGRYGELQKEIKKGTLLDWILIGALIKAILEQCHDVVRQSSRDISNYEEEEERQRRRKREESYSSHNSSYGGGGGGSFGGFGGGGSGGGGSTGRF